MIATTPSGEDRFEQHLSDAPRQLGPLRRRLTLRVKGALALAALLLYLCFVSVLFVLQKDALVREFDEIGGIHRLQDRLHDLGLALTRVTAAAHAESSPVSTVAPDQPLVLAIDEILRRAEQEGGRIVSRERLEAVAAAQQAYRASAPGTDLTEVARTLDALVAELRNANARVEALELDREAAFRAQSQTMAVTVFAAGILGIALIGAVVVLFFARITSDLEALRLRAADIIAGRRRRPIPVTRPDEVGALTGAINELAAALEARERELELERRKGFHHEKMAAIGNLAAGVLTEIGNPIAAIDGFARSLRDELRGGRALDGDGAGRIDEILEQAARLTTIAHEISEISAPQPQQRQLVDLNAVVQNAIRLLHYDTRARAVGIVMDLDHQLPAIWGMAEKLSHLVMNLAGNAIDAMGDYRAGEPGITITTTGKAGGIVLEVADRGEGMSDAVRSRAFEPFFSTKPAGQGTGLGLPLCQSIVAEHGGTIGLDSAPGRGTRVTVTFPHAPTDMNEG
jgi:two-component system NtrC family sensor kinase